MVKRQRNSIGQFMSASSVYNGQKNRITQNNYIQKAKMVFMALFFILMASPWITLAMKSKQIWIWLYSIFSFYTRHFINEDEINTRVCTPNKEDI